MQKGLCCQAAVWGNLSLSNIYSKRFINSSNKGLFRAHNVKLLNFACCCRLLVKRPANPEDCHSSSVDKENLSHLFFFLKSCANSKCTRDAGEELASFKHSSRFRVVILRVWGKQGREIDLSAAGFSAIWVCNLEGFHKSQINVTLIWFEGGRGSCGFALALGFLPLLPMGSVFGVGSPRSWGCSRKTESQIQYRSFCRCKEMQQMLSVLSWERGRTSL